MIIVNMSGAYAQQKFCASDDICKIDCTDIDGTLYFCSDEAAARIRQRLEKVPLNTLHFIDSGDYHYLSLFFLERIEEPFTLLMIDHHSDCMESAFGGELLSCGSWVLHALKLQNLKKAILIGPADEDKTLRESASHSKLIRFGEEELKKLKRAELRELMGDGPVYISLDKDVLSGAEAATDWTQGNLSLDEIFKITDLLVPGQLAGMDVCGEARRDAAGNVSEQDEINDAANRRIADKMCASELFR